MTNRPSATDAGNRIDAEENAVRECNKRTKNAKVAVSFCTPGVER